MKFTKHRRICAIGTILCSGCALYFHLPIIPVVVGIGIGAFGICWLAFYSYQKNNDKNKTEVAKHRYQVWMSREGMNQLEDIARRKQEEGSDE